MAESAAYMKIRRYVIDLIRKHAKHKERILSERELCEQFGVTRPTVRHALKALVDEGFLISKQGQGTFINPGKVMNHAHLRRKSYMIMVIQEQGNQIDMDGFYMAIVEKICATYKSLPISLRFANVDTGDADAACREIDAHCVDGILWIRPHATCAPIIDSMRQRIPVCVIGGVSNWGCLSVTSDYRRGGRLAADWFVRHGCRRPAFVGGTRDSQVKEEVYIGWQEALAQAGFPHNESRNADMECDICKRIASLASKDEIDGIFSFGSEFAAVDDALSIMGIPAARVPVVIDENHYGEYGARIKPAAKVLLFPDEIARMAAERLFLVLDQPGSAAEAIVVPPVMTVK